MLNIEVPDGTTNSTGVLYAVDLTITGKGTLKYNGYWSNAVNKGKKSAAYNRYYYRNKSSKK